MSDEIDKLRAELEAEKAAHARTQHWLDEFQGAAAAKGHGRKMQIAVDSEDLATILVENGRLRARVNELLASNTDHLIARRSECLGLNVRAFFRLAGQPIADEVGKPSDDSARFALRLIASEFFELLAATVADSDKTGLCGGLPDSTANLLAEAKALVIDTLIARGDYAVDLPEAIDAIADLKYVLEGLAVRCGVDMRPIEAEVHAKNMAKRGGPKDEHGKQLKPPGWTPPDIAGLLRDQGWDGVR